MARSALFLTLLAAAACLCSAQVPTEAPYNSVAAAANPENFKGYATWPLTIKEVLKNAECATDDTIFNLDFLECNLWFIEELAAGKPDVSKVHCSEACALQWGTISRRCYNQFKKHLKDSPTFKKEAKEFFAECDAKVPDLKFDEEKPKIEKGVNFASVKDEKVNAASLAPVEKVEKKDVAAEPVPISEPMPEDMADMDSATGTPVIMPIDEEPLPPASVVERLISTNATLLLELVELADLVDELEAFNGTVFAPTEEAIEALKEVVEAANITVTPELAKSILLYHLSAEYLTSQDLQIADDVTTLNAGAPALKVERDGDSISLSGVGSTAAVLAADLTAGDAIVHSVDAVLLPIEVEEPEAPAPLEVEPVAASGAAASLASTAALAAGLLAAALLM